MKENIMISLGLLLLCLLSTILAKRTSTIEKESVRTPFGVYPAGCVHQIPEGALVDETSETHIRVTHPDGKQIKIARCKRSLKERGARFQGKNEDGWQAYTYLKADNITTFLGKWTVPNDPPQYDDQTIFLFPGLQNINWIPPDPTPSQAFDIIQPVLQYGPSAAGGYDYWAIASWYVTLTDDVVYSPLKQVSTGDVIFGNMTQVGPSSWYINSVDSTSGVKTDFTIKRTILSTQPWAYVTLEAYGIYNCDLFPTAPVTFDALQIMINGQWQSPQWKTGTKDPICNSQASVKNPSSVSISFLSSTSSILAHNKI